MPNSAANDATCTEFPITNQPSDFRCAVRPRYAKNTTCATGVMSSVGMYTKGLIQEKSARKLIRPPIRNTRSQTVT